MSKDNGAPAPDNRRLLPLTPPSKPEQEAPAPYRNFEELVTAFNRLGATLPLLLDLAGRAEMLDPLVKRIAKLHGSKGLKVPNIPLHPQGKLEIQPIQGGFLLNWREPGPGIITAQTVPKLPPGTRPKG